MLSLIDKYKRKPSEPSLKIENNCRLFEDVIGKNQDKLEVVFKGLEKLMIVEISLVREDNHQLIFEGMNSTSKDLTQTDLIRNYTLMGLETKKQKVFYQKYWRTMEKGFEQDEDLFNKFVRHYLTIKTGEIPNKQKVYEDFKLTNKKRG